MEKGKNKSVTVTARSLDEALKDASSQLAMDISMLNFEVLSSDEGSVTLLVSVKEDKNIISDEEADEIDKYLDRLEVDIVKIETEEILHGYTAEDLKIKGLTSNAGAEIERSKYSTVNQDAGYTFVKGVDHLSLLEYDYINEVPFEEVEILADVKPGHVIAERAIKNEEEKTNIINGYSHDYLSQCNIQVFSDERKISYKARIKGKLVIINGLLFIIGSDIDGKCEIKIAEDRMSATMDIYPAYGEGAFLTVSDILEKMNIQGITFGILESKIKSFIDLCKVQRKVIKDIIIAEGLEPIEGLDSEMIINFSQDAEVSDLTVLPDGRVDYRRKTNIPIVKKGSLLASIGEPTMGTDGMDVMGNTIKAKPGDKAVLYPGQNVVFDDDSGEFYAVIDGLPSLNKNIISIFQQYVVPGDVDFSSGNIEFDGNIIVNGSVLPGFEVKASGDVMVMKNVEAGSIEAGRDIKVSGGVIGGEQSKIICGRDFYANHLQNAHIEAQGNINIRKSSFQSEIYSTGSIFMKTDKGALVGGEAIALNEIDVRLIGSISGTKTKVVAGQDYLIRKMKVKYNEAKEFCSKNLAKIENVLNPLLKELKNKTEVKKEQKNKISLILKKHNELSKHIKIMEAKIKQLDKEAGRRLEAKVKAKDIVYPDVMVGIKNQTIVVKKEEHNVSFYINKDSLEIAKGKY